MKYSTLSMTLLFVLGLIFCGAPAYAQATRTWVSGVGDDANPCSRTAPCKTFAGAISKTAAAGEINCLDPGGFGALTITKAISIQCTGVIAGVLVAGTNGITVNAGATDVVLLSGLDFDGTGTGLSGVSILSAAEVTIENSTIRGFTVAGVNVAPSTGGIKVNVLGSLIADNAATGILFKPTGSGNTRGLVDNTKVLRNSGDGIMVNGTTTTASPKVLVRNSEAAHNTSNGFVAFSSGSTTQLMIESSSANNNTAGIAANGSGATVRFTRSNVTSNSTGVLQVSSGAVLSYSTNSVGGNDTDGTFGTTPQN